MTTYDIFISYAHGENDSLIPQAHRMYLALQEAGFKVWFDVFEMPSNTDPKQDQKIMKHAIQHSKIFLALISPEYMNSYNCNFEYSIALKKNLPILQCSVNSHYTYRTTHFKYINFETNTDLPIVNTINTRNFKKTMVSIISQIKTQIK